MRRLICVIGMIATCTMLTTATPAFAQATGACCAPGSNFGVRAGVTADPTQVLIGAHLESPPLTPSNRFSFRPNADITFGDHAWGISGNLEFLYWVRFPNSAWAAYFGGGPAIQYIKPDGVDGRTGGAFSGVVGFQHDSGLFIDFKDQAGTAKLAVGYIFRR
jgi:hypothetical protein